MSRTAPRLACLIAGCCTAAAVLTGAVAEDAGRGTRDRPPPAHTGGFSEPTCEACHFDGGINEGDGDLALTGLPDSYVPGEVYTVRLTLTGPGLQIGGFQLAVRFDHDGRQAGTLTATGSEPATVEVTRHDDVDYAHHTFAGTSATTADTAYWEMKWTAPSGGGDIVIHAVANAADDDASPLGDEIYSVSARSTLSVHRPMPLDRTSSSGL